VAFAPTRRSIVHHSPTDGTDENGLSSIAHYQRRTCDPCHRSTRGAEGRFPQVPASQAQGRLRSLRSLDPLSQDQGPSTGQGRAVSLKIAVHGISKRMRARWGQRWLNGHVRRILGQEGRDGRVEYDGMG
jgi:hypothetical protein